MNENSSSIVKHYYTSLYSGDLQSVKDIMTERSYIMMLESFGLRLSLEDPAFKIQLAKIEEDKSSLLAVEKKLSVELASRNRSPQINILQVQSNGTERQTVEYTEDGKAKKLYFSKKDDLWLIDYYAGRPIPAVPESYFSLMKKWIISILPSFK
jgi:hypothetical protein